MAQVRFSKIISDGSSLSLGQHVKNRVRDCSNLRLNQLRILSCLIFVRLPMTRNSAKTLIMKLISSVYTQVKFQVTKSLISEVRMVLSYIQLCRIKRLLPAFC